MNYQEKLKMFNEKPEEDKKEHAPKPEVKKFNKGRLAMFNQNNNSSNQEKKPNIKKFDKNPNTLEKKDKKEKFDNSTDSSLPKKERKQIIFEKSSVISEENSDKIIRKYPNLPSNPRSNKIILFIGDNQEAFINTIINMYSNLDYKDNYRYKIESTAMNDKLRTYNIASISDNKDIFIIAFPYFNRVEEIFINDVIKDYIDLSNKKLITRIDYLFITVEKDKILNRNELIYFLHFINLSFDEKLKERIIILFPSDKESKQGENNKEIINDIFQDNKENILFEKNLDFNALFIPEYFYINNKIIYEKNNSSEEEAEWKALSEAMKNLQNKISNSISQTFNINQIPLINKIIQCKDKTLTISNFPEIKKIEKKRDQIILLNFLTYSSIKNDISNIIIYLFQKIDRKIRLSKTMKDINFSGFKNLNTNICALSKIEFNNLESINFQNCDIEDITLNIIQDIFNPKLISLNLSENKLTNLQIFNNENIFISLIDLDLSNNNIEEIDPLMMGQFPNLKILNLSHNKIINIKCMDKDLLNFNKLEELNLSYNNIKEIIKINIPSLRNIIMINNPISQGIIELSYGVDELILENKNDILNFNFSKYDSINGKNIINIIFAYISDKNNINNILEKVNLKNINKLIIKGFENLDFLINDTLDKLVELDLKDNNINDISFLNNVKFDSNLKELYIDNNIYFLKGFNTLQKLKNINIKIIYIKQKENKYIAKIIYNTNNKINFIFDDLEFFKEELFLKSEKIDIEQSLWDNNINFLFEAIKNINSYPLFKRKPKELIINFKNNIYEIICKNDNYYSNLKMNFISEDLNIFKYEFFNSITKIEFNDVIFDDNIDLSLKTMPNLEKIRLKNNTIKSIKIFDIIKELKEGHLNIESDYLNKCEQSLLNFLNEQVSMKSINIFEKDNNYCIIYYSSPFNFSIYIDKKRLNDIKSFKSCSAIDLNKMGLNDDDINFLKNDSILDLNTLVLDDNKITNIEFLDKIKSTKLDFVSIKNNLINDGIKYIEDNIKSEKLSEIVIKKKSSNDNIFIFSLKYNGNYHLDLDLLYEANDNLEILLKQINLENISSLDLSNLNLKNLEFLSNKYLTNIKTLKLDNNQIEDISIFSDINLKKLEDLSIKNNPIRKGLQVLKSEFFKKCPKIYIKVSKKENEYKINAEFNYPKLNLEFFINNIEDIKNIFDFEVSYVNLNRNNNEEDDESIFNKVKNLLNEIQNNNNDMNDKDEININNKVYDNDNYYYNKNKNFWDNDEEESKPQPHIIIDNGSSYIKVGLSGEGGPRSVFPTCIGYPKYKSGMIGKNEYFIGADTEAKRGVLKLNFPIERGYVENWDDMEKIWRHIFTNELRVASEEHNIMITETPNNCKENREKIAQIMFETFNVTGLYIANPAVLSLYAGGKFYGISIDSGESTSIVPIFDGYPISFFTKKLNIGGKDLTNYLPILLEKRGYRFSTTAEKEIIKAIKEKSCYMALDYQEELKSVEPYDYELPDGYHVIIKDERIRCPEALFRPDILGKDDNGLGQICYDVIQSCDIDIRRDMYNCIVLSGGNTMFNGLPERLTKEIGYLVPYEMREEIKVIASPERKFATWIGGSILSSISTFESCWITRNEYEESGATIVHRKCL